MSIELVKELLQDADALGYIRAGAYPNEYDKAAASIFERLSPDLSVDQIARVIWYAFYYEFLVGTVGKSNDYWSVGKNEAVNILGDASRYTGIAKTIRHVIYRL
jgi:hypothetical protein